MLHIFKIVSRAVANAIRKNVSGRFLIGIDANLVPTKCLQRRPAFSFARIAGSVRSERAAALLPDVVAGVVLRGLSKGLRVRIALPRVALIQSLGVL